MMGKPGTQTAPTRSHPAAVQAATAALKIVLRESRPGVHYRLWDGSEGWVGLPDRSFTLIIRDPNVLRAAFSSTNTKTIAEAYIENRIDVEGDLFACVRLANQLEDRRIGWRDKFTLWRLLRQVGP